MDKTPESKGVKRLGGPLMPSTSEDDHQQDGGSSPKRTKLDNQPDTRSDIQYDTQPVTQHDTQPEPNVAEEMNWDQQRKSHDQWKSDLFVPQDKQASDAQVGNNGAEVEPTQVTVEKAVSPSQEVITSEPDSTIEEIEMPGHVFEEAKAPTASPEAAIARSDITSDDEITSQNDSDSQELGADPERATRETSHDSSPTAYRYVDPDLLQKRQRELLSALPQGFPRLACYLPDFKEAEGLVEFVCDKFIAGAQEIKKQGYVNEEIDVVCDDLAACRSAEDQYGKVGPVACLGTTGKGKTSTISSLLDDPDAGFASGGSKRGTYISHEYCAASPDEAADLVVELFYLSSDRIKTQVKEFVANILRYLQLRSGEDEDGSDDELDEDESALIDIKGITALECLADVLCGERRFANTQSIEEFCREKLKQNASSDKIFKEFMPTLKALMAPRKRDHDVETLRATESKALHQKVRQLTRGSMNRRGVDREPSAWPFVTKVQVRQVNKYLDAGLILADTPGSGDNNYHVVENTQRSIQDAGTIMIITHHLRFHDDEALRQHLKTCIRLGKMNNIILVLTKIDEMSNYNEEERLSLSPEEAGELDAAETRLEVLRLKVEETRQKKQNARANKMQDDYMRYDGDLQDLEAAEKKAEAHLRQSHIMLRCNELRRQATEMLRAVDKSAFAPKLKAFPISNTQYQLHLSNNGKKCPFLDLEATGIPSLRRELLTISAGGKSRTLQHICTRKLPWLFAGIELILTKTPVERKDKLRNVVAQLICEESSIFKDMKRELMNSYDKTIIKAISDNIPGWSEACSGMLNIELSTLHGGTLLGVLRRDGKWKHKKLGKVFNLTKNIHEIFLLGNKNKKIVVAFEKFGDYYLGLVVKQFYMRLKDKLDKLRKTLTEGQYGKGMRMGPFSRYIMGTYDDIEHAMEKQFAKLEAKITSIRHALTLEPMNDDYDEKNGVNGEMYQHIFGRAMGQSYKESRTADDHGKLKGKAAKRARLAVIEANLTTPDKEKNLFHCVGNMGRERLESFFDEWAETSADIVNGAFAKIQQNFDTHFRDQQTIKSEDQPEAEEKLKSMIAEANSVIGGRMKELMDTCASFERTNSTA
ncbi:Hypothetical predicted protein [Lecanosticta acicola]|uniref:Uncharacterized protein n=1 Tax=Lecanosticta acicola TaxID=111012 RepID=A0AAI9E8B3_9PEZI|nr:Hypothetical predicted protein [Lecanosticta acicola]